jgi:hypothetical protein
MCVSKIVGSNISETSFGTESYGILSSYDNDKLIDKFEDDLQRYLSNYLYIPNYISYITRYTIFICVCSYEKQFNYLFNENSVVNIIRDNFELFFELSAFYFLKFFKFKYKFSLKNFF